MLFPAKPDDLNALSATELRAFARTIKGIAKSQLESGTLTDEARTEVNEYLGLRKQAMELATQKEADAETAKALAADDSDDEPEGDNDDAGDGDEGGDGGDDAANGDGKQLAAVGAKAPKIRTSMGQGQPAAPPAPDGTNKRITPEFLTAGEGVPGHNQGDKFKNWTDLATAMQEKSWQIGVNTEQKFTVASIKGEYAPDRQLSENIGLNLARFEREELLAALCAPAVPYYGLACTNSTRRPVFASPNLPGFQAPRMKVSVQSSPQLSDITTGHGSWSATDDSSGGSKQTCQTIACGTTTEYAMYGLYRCLTVTNMLAMSYPELVEAYLNRLAAAHARDGEVALLNAMGAAATFIQANLLGYGATTSIVTTILNYIALYQETQRWDITENMVGWLPRWVKTAMKMDLFRRRSTGINPINSVQSDAVIDGMFRDAGVDINWYMDTPSWDIAIPVVATAGRLNLLPQNIHILLHPPGKFALMDRGELTIGVTGNGIYRDNASNAKNTFTFFFENFEGVVNTTSCPCHIVDIPVCWTGVQVDDNFVACNGQDELGYQS